MTNFEKTQLLETVWLILRESNRQTVSDKAKLRKIERYAQKLGILINDLANKGATSNEH